LDVSGGPAHTGGGGGIAVCEGGYHLWPEACVLQLAGRM
jgi:hypothetical protein